MSVKNRPGSRRHLKTLRYRPTTTEHYNHISPPPIQAASGEGCAVYRSPAGWLRPITQSRRMLRGESVDCHSMKKIRRR
ncbi:MAG TPA: hypothetical protein PLX65_09785 [Accumulibacter sp.]|nr:hypothetical protein [Accumulibacter sp.]